ncbi:N-ethylammeline chlorohydrolase [Streptococcus pneumoniae]|nr:N-ethylammeline chlorohydrolase [Streptococcus pneumoniae]
MKKLDTMRFNVGRFTSFSTEIESFPKIFLYSMKIKVQTRKLAAGCSKHCFEVVDETDEVSNHTYGKVKLTWFEEIFEEY